MAIPAVRFTDEDYTHCDTPYRMDHAKTVLVNGLGWSRLGDYNTPHLRPCEVGCCVHNMPICQASLTVFAEGRNVGRIGDPIAACTFAGQTFSPNVLAG